MPITLFDHYTVRARDFEATKSFYEQVMNLRPVVLHDLGFPIALMHLDDQAVVHILGTGPGLDAFLKRDGRAYVSGVERKTGNMEHVAFNGTDADAFKARLKKTGTAFSDRTLDGYGVYQLLFDDPDGVEIEVNFPLAEKSGR